MSDKIGLVVLAAGQGTRLKLNVPKPLAPLLGQTLLDFSLDAAESFFKDVSANGSIELVVGHKKELLIDHVQKRAAKHQSAISFVEQDKPQGTGHALKCYFDQSKIAKGTDYTVVMCADTPVIQGSDLVNLLDFLKEEKLDGVAATFLEDNPKGYGRIVRGNGGFHIIEEKDATDEIRKINEVNSGLYVFRTSFVLNHINEIDSNNKAGEFYLTDLFKESYKVRPVVFENKDTFLGINDLFQLEAVGHVLRKRLLNNLISNGVRVIDSSSTFIEANVEVGTGSVLYPNVYLGKGTKLGINVTVEPGAVIFESSVENEVTIKAYSHLELATVKNKASVGPFARLRKGSLIGEKTKIGNFVETKNTTLGQNVGISHLSYVGDAEVGDNTNLGCGFITCNYDGESKHLTKIGKDCFIGSDTQMIAPIEVEDSCYVASGSTINQSMKEGSFAVARGRQVTKDGMAKRFLKGKWSKSK